MPTPVDPNVSVDDKLAPSPSKARAAQRKLEALQKRNQALDLRLFGFTYQQIADKLGYTKQAAFKAISAALDAIPRENADRLRALEVDRLDRMLAILAKRVTTGDLGAIDRWLRISERRCRLLGLDAPTKIDATVAGGMVIVQCPFDPVDVTGPPPLLAGVN